MVWKKEEIIKTSTYNGKSDRLLPGDLIFYRKRVERMEDIKISTISPCMLEMTRSYMQMEAGVLQLSMVPQSCSNRQTSKIKEKYT